MARGGGQRRRSILWTLGPRAGEEGPDVRGEQAEVLLGQVVQHRVPYSAGGEGDRVHHLPPRRWGQPERDRPGGVRAAQRLAGRGGGDLRQARTGPGRPGAHGAGSPLRGTRSASPPTLTSNRRPATQVV